MTLLETERLVRKICELQQQRSNPELAPKLAADYAAVCHAANLRLQQCEAMCKGGDRLQALQLAETAPSLPELVTVLDFSGAEDWRAFCQKNAMPVAERLDTRSVEALSHCYAQGITTEHPLYAAYRKAVLSRHEEEALQTLQSITRLNPADGNAAAELARLDAKVLGGRLEQLGELLADRDTAQIVAAVEAIEAFGFKNRPAGDVWSEAQLVRCGFLLEETARLKAASEWMEALAKLDFIRRLETEFKLELTPAVLRQLEALETWARGEQEKDQKNREFGALLSELQYRIQQSEEKDTSARYVKLPELREDFEALHKVWRCLTDFTRPIPGDAAAAFQKRSALLEGEIARRTALGRRAIIAGITATLLLGGAVVWFVLGQMKAREFTRQLQVAVSRRQPRTAEQLLSRLRTNEQRLLSVGRVSAAAASAESFVTREHGLLTNFEAAFASLRTPPGGEPEGARMTALAEQLALARTALNALAPDLQAENEPRLQAFERQWQQFLAESAVAVDRLLEQYVGSAERQCAQLDYRVPLDAAVAQLATVSNTLRQLNACEAGFTNLVTLRSDLLQRAAAVRARFDSYNRELRKLDDGMAALKKARTFDEFSSAISLIVSAEYSAAPAVAAATAIQSVCASDEALLRALLGATNPATWAFIQNTNSTSLVPEIAMPAERAIFQRLKADPAVSANHWLYRLWLDREGTTCIEWITIGSFENSVGWKQIRAWTPSPTATSATFEDRDYGYFDGQWKLSPTQPVYRLEQVADWKNPSVYDTVGVTKVWSGGNTYDKPLLEVLDATKDSRDGSPVFRAYLFYTLLELMELQPDAWGLSFCPSARAHAAQLRDLVGGQLASGDWFVPAKTKRWSDRLEQFFLAENAVSYARQAAGNLALAQSAARDGLRYVGFAALDGKPVVTRNPRPAEIWGYDATRKQPVLITGPALPLSPLFALPAPRAEYLAKAGVSPEAPSFTNALPPLFRASTTP